MQETSLSWVGLLPAALLKSEEFDRDRFSPFEIPAWTTTLASQLKGRHQRTGELGLI